MESKQTPASATKVDAIKMLTDDHKKVKKLFKEFEKLSSEGSDEEKAQLVKEICTELTIHAQVEEEIFYPAARSAIEEEEQDLMDEAEVEHAGAKDLISQLETMMPDEDLYDAKVTVLGEYVNHHIKEEEDEMFPLLKKAKLDMLKLGTEISKLKEQLKAETDIAPAVPKKTVMASAKKPKTSIK